ncbi:MAG: branched-chain amino acid ABC transporter permease [Spirochaetota bacterium]|nr:branched-chain amino acid ABC transporter permease [Spirochaetota bacterium]
MFNIPTSELFQHLINGLTLGSIYALIALGYTMVYGILKFINFAHGEILMFGTYIALLLFNSILAVTNNHSIIFLSFIVVTIIGMSFSSVLGIIIEKIAYRPLRKASRLAPLLSAIGISISLMNIAALLFGTKPKKFHYPFNNDSFDILGVSITPHQILILVVGMFMMVSLKLFIDHTRLGKAMRATSENQDIAAIMGINVDFIISLTFAIGSALAAAAGVLIALEYKVEPTMGAMAGLKAFIAAVVGGIGSISGAMLGGIALGLLETFGVVILGIPLGYKDTIAFSILIIILLFRPSGILRKNVREKV